MKETASRRLVLVGLPEDLRKRVRDALGMRGNTFHVLPTLRDALELTRQIEPSIVIAGANLTDGNGYDLCRQIKEINRLTHVGVIMVVENSAAYDHALGILSGVDRFIETQLDAEPLADVLLEVADKVEAEVAIAARPTATVKKTNVEIPQPPPEPTAPPPPPTPVPAPPDRNKTASRMMPKTSDPLRAFFDDETPAAAQPSSAPTVDASLPEIWFKRFEKVSDLSSAEIARYLEQWIEFHYGQRVDENMRLEVPRVLKQHMQTIIQNTIRKLMEE